MQSWTLFLGRLSKIILLTLFLLGSIFFVTPVQAVNSNGQCVCTMSVKRVLKEVPLPASNGPAFGYADPVLHCALSFNNFGNKYAATALLDGTMCGGHCIEAGRYCPRGLSCKHDLDCEKGTVCENGACVDAIFMNPDDPSEYPKDHTTKYDYALDKSVIKKENCENPQYINYEYGTDRNTANKPCGSFCAVYYGQKCQEGARCKANTDCVSGFCSVGGNDTEYGLCKGSGDSTPNDSFNSVVGFQTIIETIKFKPANFIVDDTSSNLSDLYKTCLDEAYYRPEANPPSLKVELGEKINTIDCSASTKVDEVVETDKNTSVNNSSFNVFKIPDSSELNQLGTTDVKEFIARIIQGLLGILGSISLVMFIYGGILLMTDRGSGDQAGTAKEILVWTSLGLAVVFASYAILKFVFEFFS